MRKLTHWLIPLLSLLTLVSCHQGKEPSFNESFLAFGTLINVTITNEKPEYAAKAIEMLEQDFEKRHKQWHAWHKGELTQINKLISQNKEATIPDEMLPLITKGIALNKSSKNLFNPAIGKLINLWGFHDDSQIVKQPPSPGAVSYLLKQKPSMQDLTLTGNKLTSTNPNVQIDFGAYGKGYGIQLAIERLRKLHIDNALINAGGDVSTIGSRGGRAWRVAIRSPKKSSVFATADIFNNESIFTSGDYERHFIYEGINYHHIIDPRTGYPAIGASSVTVIDNDPTVADAAATALLIAGPSEWYKIAKKMGIKYVALLDSTGTLHLNPAMKKRLTILNKKIKQVVSEPLFDETTFKSR